MRIWITGDNKAQCDLIVIELWADSCSQWNSKKKLRKICMQVHILYADENDSFNTS